MTRNETEYHIALSSTTLVVVESSWVVQLNLYGTHHIVHSFTTLVVIERAWVVRPHLYGTPLHQIPLNPHEDHVDGF